MKRISLLMISSLLFLSVSCQEGKDDKKDDSKGKSDKEQAEKKDDKAMAEDSKDAKAEESPAGSYGAEITADDVTSMDMFIADAGKLGNEDVMENVKIQANINSCCQKKGCWMMVDLGNGEEMRVTFKDYGFFVPLNSEGSEVIMRGKAFMQETSVDDLKHYAEDAGKSEEEIAAITEPEFSLAFEADGVLIKE